MLASWLWLAGLGAVVALTSMVPRCAWAADVTISNQVRYHHREVFVSLEAVPLEQAVRAIYRRALAPRGVSFVDSGPRAAGDRITIQFQGPPWVLLNMISELLDARGYSMLTTEWGSDVIVRRDVVRDGRDPPVPPPPSPPVSPLSSGGGGLLP